VFRLLPGAALNVVLTGCLRIDVDLNIPESESIDGEIVLAVSEELAQVTGQSRDELIAQFETNVMRNAPEGVTKESYRDGELEGTRLTLDAVPVAAFNPADETLSIVHEGDHYIVNGKFDLAALTGELSETEQQALEGVADAMDVRVAITFPGRVLDHNGELDGQTVSWVPTGVEAIEIHARAEDSALAEDTPRPEDSTPARSFAGPAVAALLIVSVVVVLTLLRRRSNQPRESA
jgi:hypothetical protein